MLNRIVTISIGLSILAVFPAWGLDLKPGKYAITAKVEMPGMPGGMPPQTTTQCLDEQNPVPDASSGTPGCKVADVKTKGNTVSYTLKCEQEGMKTQSTGEITYKGDTFEGSMKMTMGPSGGGVSVTTRITGKRVGKCD